MECVAHLRQLPAPYIAGQLYLREMPAIVVLLAKIANFRLIVVDGYVWLGKDRRGFGAHLYEHLDGRCPVIGAAKRPFRDNDCAVAVRRGNSDRPLYVTAIGIELGQASVTFSNSPNLLSDDRNCAIDGLRKVFAVQASTATQTSHRSIGV
jgi:deoxyinosine 3'endonuclease (endonuclease V)